jgi:large subunit ribosomal protein L9
MKIIFLKEVRGVGKKNEVKEVPDGYARNFLLPRGLARVANNAAMSELKNKIASELKHLENIRNKVQELEKTTSKAPLKFYLKTGERGEVFGSITAREIEEKLKSDYQIIRGENFEVKNEQPLKTLGWHEVEINFGRGVAAKIKVLIEKSPNS